MKKGKPSASKLGSGAFSLSNTSLLPAEKVFAGYPPFDVSLDWEPNPERDLKAELDHVLTILRHSDQYPPAVDSVQARSVYFCICFESWEQKIAFLRDCDLYRCGDKYMAAEDFAAVFGIDLATGSRSPVHIKKAMSFAASSGLNFGQGSLDFDKRRKPEISEKLKNIRADEKQLAEYMKWTAEPEYWLCLCFRTENDKANMLKALGLELEFEGKYLWCHDVATILGVDLVPCHFRNKGVYAGRDKSLNDLVIDQ